MQKLIVASNNQNKIKEISEILKDYYNVVPMRQANVFEEIAETGSTFLENALIKASYISKKLGCDALADDSGLCVDALSGAPGVFSARYSGVGATDSKNNLKLLKALTGIKNRNAKFVCCMVLYRKDGSYIYAEGEVLGKILEEEKGEFGFGYDPLFYSDEIGKTFAEAAATEKNTISHRARALSALLKKIKNG